ncbi:MAG: hypothetical protein HC808_09045 [Candidatus Competibacteraceae bacterium]|nr:hypothetical protein [Candidatus Competibacteraceae bacterium]
MAKSFTAIPLSGLNPADPTVTPGMGLALTPAQRQQLETVQRQAPSPAILINELRQALRRGEPLTRILEQLRANNQMAVIRQYAIKPPQWDAVQQPAYSPSQAPRSAPRPGG